MSKSIILIGSSGFVGRSIVKHFSSIGYDIYIVNVREIRKGTTEYLVFKMPNGEIVQQREIPLGSIVVNAAGCAHRAFTKEEYREGSIVLSHLVFDVCKTILASRIIHVGSLNCKLPSSDGLTLDLATASKKRAEAELKKLVHNTGIKLQIVRCPTIYDSNVKGNYKLIEKLIRLKVPLPFGAFSDNSRSIISLQHLNSFLENLISNNDHLNDTFEIDDGNPLSTSQLFNFIGDKIGRKVTLIKMPKVFVRLVLKAIGKDAMYVTLDTSLTADMISTVAKTQWRFP